MPLEFTPVLGILVGVVLTLMLVAFVVILVLRLKYQTNKAKNNGRGNTKRQHQQHPKNKRKGRTKANNPSAIPNDKDAEEYYCMTLEDSKVETKNNRIVSKNIENVRLNSSLKATNKNRQENSVIGVELNPDVIPNRHKAQIVTQSNHQKHSSVGKTI